jgi:peptide/nickel transport system permease protein
MTAETTATAPTAAPRRSGLARAFDSDLWHSFTRSPVAIVASLVALTIFAAALAAPLIAPQNAFDPSQLDLMDGFTRPGEAGAGSGRTFTFGSDDQGRDVFSAILYGSRLSIFIGFASVAFSMVLGVGLGLVAGYVGGRTEAVIMRIADVQLSFPAILIALMVMGIVRGLVPPSQHEQVAVAVVIFAIGLSNWAQYARTVRASTLVEKRKEYVEAARLLGISSPNVMLSHVLPNVAGPILVIGTINLALAVIEEATLSYLGVGVPITQPSLGTLIRFGQQYLFSGEWWILFFPALTLVLLALAVNLLGDWLRDALNPKLR